MASDDVEEIGVARSGKRRVVGAVVVVGLLALLASFRGLLTLYTDYLWFDDLERTSVWTGVLSAQIILSVVFVSIFFVLAWLNLVIADRIAPALRPPGPEEEMLIRWHETVGRRNGLIRFAIAGFFALVAGGGAAAQWNDWVLFTNPVEFGQVDPVFGRDISFYIFRLPFLNFVVDWFFAAFVIIGVITGIWHYINGGIRMNTIDRRTTPQVKAHVSVILAVLAALKAADYYLQRFALLTSNQGFARGAFFTDLNATLPAIQLLLLISLFSVGLLVANIWRRGWALPTVAVGLWGLIAVLAGGIYPTVIQQFQVAPDEISNERQFIDRNIEATRIAVGLDEVVAADFPFDDTPLSREEVLGNAGAFSTVRLLDPRVVDDSFTRNQQDLDIYSSFERKVDVDRYEIDGVLTPVVVASREISNEATVNDGSWQLRHAVRTHGYGLVLAPANDFNSNGDPEFLIGGVPLENRIDDSIFIDRPQIYFGEGITSYAVTGTTEEEFDFIEGYQYDGAGGIPMSSFFDRVAFAFRFGAIEPVISGIVTDETEIMFARDVTERASRIAPFLEYDADPYPIVVDGGISYVIDAYTTSDQFPYAQAGDTSELALSSGLNKRFNYVRNSVKVVVDGYDGNVDFYITDPDDPLINAYRQEFDGLFRDASEMPDEVAAHVRYPQDLFMVQTSMWGRYQLNTARQFFDDALSWNVAGDPDEITGTTGDAAAAAAAASAATGLVDPYYQVTQLPDEDEPGFVLSRTFVPKGLPELRSYMIGRTDTSGRLELRQYEIIGTNQSALGPVQVGENLNADPTISEESTELGRGGSQFLSGNLVPLLIENAVVYVRPFYVKQAPSPNEVTAPQVKFVAVIQEERLGFAPTYAGALAQLFDITLEEARALTGGATIDVVPLDGSDPDEPSGPSGTLNLGEASGQVKDRLDDVLAKFAQAETALPDFAEYQRLQNEALEELQQLLDDVEVQEADEEPVIDEDDDPDSA